MAESAAAAAKETRSELDRLEATAFRAAPSFFFKIWPPTQRTRERDAVLHRLVETLTTQSVLSNRYGLLSEEKSTASARSIEEEAFFIASSATAAGTGADDNGIEVLHVYSREISRRVTESAKAMPLPLPSTPLARLACENTLALYTCLLMFILFSLS